MTGPNFSVIRARLRYESLDDFIAGYTRFISRGGMFIPMAPNKLKPVGTTIRFQYLLQDGSTAMLGEGTVRQLQGINSGDSGPVGMLIKFTRLNRETKQVVDQVLAYKNAGLLLEDSEAPALDDTPIPGTSGSTLQGVAPAQADEDDADEDAYLFGADDEEDAQPDETDDEGSLFAPSVTPAAPFAVEDSDDDLFAPSAPPAAPFAVEDSDDDLFASATPPAAPFAAGDSDDDLFGLHDLAPTPDAEPALDLQPDSDPFDLADVISSTPDESSAVFSAVDPAEILSADAVADVAPAAEASQDTPAPAASQPEGHKRLGRTEAGLQIMAFDELPEDEVAGLAALDFGGDADDVDQMFDDVFGGGDLFADEPDLDAPAGDSAPVAAPGGVSGADFLDAEDALLDEHPDLLAEDPETSFPAPDSLDALLGETALDGGQPLQPSAGAHGFKDDPFESASEKIPSADLQDEESLDSLEDLLAQEESVPAAAENSVGFEMLDDEALDEPAKTPGIAGRAFSLDLDSEPDEAIQDPRWSSPPAKAAAFDAKLEAEDAGPSPDLLSVLDAIDEDAPIVPDLNRLTLGAGTQLPAIDASTPPPDDDVDSLSALLAQAQQELDARRDPEEAPAEAAGDLFDDLLGGDHQLPPPPDLQPMFDIASPEAQKKKKGGFISKLFGKD